MKKAKKRNFTFFELCNSESANSGNTILKKKLYGPFLWMGFNCLKARATSRGNLLFTTKSSEIPGTHFINLRRVKR